MAKGKYPPSELLEDFRLACLSRALDDREITLQRQSRVFFQIAGAGHEALLLGLARYLRAGYDWFFPYYRDRALLLALGLSPGEMLLQAVGSSEDPASGGRQMPCHWGDTRLNVASQTSPTASQCLPAVGCAEASRYIVRRPELPGCSAHGDELTYVSVGDGACSSGEFWESLNTACTLSLPVVYVVADNGYAISVPVSDQAPAPISELVRGFRGLRVAKVDGRDYFAVRRVAGPLVAHVRAGTGPALIHAQVTRPYSHSGADTQSKYRGAEELAEESHFDPIDLMEHHLISDGVMTSDRAGQIRLEVKAEVAAAAKEALAAPRPDPESVRDHVYCLPDLTEDLCLAPSDGTGLEGEVVGPKAGPRISGGPEAGPMALGEAIRSALHEAMENDERIRVFGEDVADAREAVLANVEGKGGVFGTTLGLQRRFGLARCYNTPLAEANIVGRAIGQAVRGLKPVPEIQFFDYIWTAMQQIRSEAATMRWRSNGHFTCPMVIRAPIGGYLTGGAIWHSQCGESIFTHIPGLLVAFPSRTRDAVGLLRAAFAGQDPVLFLEHKHLLRQPYTADRYPDPGYVVPFGRAAVVRPGTGASIITYGATVEKCRRAIERYETDHDRPGAVELIDLRSLSPWDREMVGQSVVRTGRALVVHEDTLTCGFGAEVAAWISSECFDHLDAPVRRRGALDTHVAYEPTLEDRILPQVDDLIGDIADLLAY